MSLSQTIYEAIRDWAHQMLDTPAIPASEGLPGTPKRVFPVIQAFQDGPAPAENYIAIGDAPTLRRVGQGIVRPVYASENPEVPTPDTLTVVQDYTGRLSVREVGGHGDNLRRMIDGIDLPSVRKILSDASVSVLSIGEIIPVPSLPDRKWDREYLVEIDLAVAVEASDEMGWIETAETDNNLERRTP